MGNGPKDFKLLLQPTSVALVILDHQDDFLAELSPAVRDPLASNTLALTKVAKACGVPVMLSSLASEAFRGETWPPLRDLFPKVQEVQREHINCWDDRDFVSGFGTLNKERLLLAGLWTETAITFAALSGLELGYRIYLATDAMAGMSVTSHETAIARMVQAGVVPVTWKQLLFEWYRMSGPEDGPVSQALLAIAREHGLVLGKPSPEND